MQEREGLQARLRALRALRAVPADAIEQHRQLRLGERHAAAGCVRPDEVAVFEALGEQAQAVAAPPQHLDDVAAPAEEDEDVAGEWILGQRGNGDAI